MGKNFRDFQKLAKQISYKVQNFIEFAFFSER